MVDCICLSAYVSEIIIRFRRGVIGVTPVFLCNSITYQMKRLLDILKTTALGGIGILLPLLLLCLLIREIFEFVVALADPITLLFPEGMLERLNAGKTVRSFLITAVELLTEAVNLLVNRRIILHLHLSFHF